MTYMFGRQLKQEVVGNNRALSGNKELETSFTGHPAINEKVCYLPPVGEDQPLSKEEVYVMRGAQAHEVGGHATYSDMPMIMAKYKRWAKIPHGELRRWCHNMLEDVMIERRRIEESPGTAKYFTAMVNWLRDLEAPKHASVLKDKVGRQMSAVSIVARKEYGGPVNDALMADFTADEIAAKGRESLALTTDITKTNEIQAMVQAHAGPIGTAQGLGDEALKSLKLL